MIKEIEFIVGPDAVRDTRQMREVLTFARQNGLKKLRGGIVKPRSTPFTIKGEDSWVGVGIKAGGAIINKSLRDFKGEFTLETWSTNDTLHFLRKTRKINPTINIQIGARTGPGNLIAEIGQVVVEANSQSNLVVKNSLKPGAKDFVARVDWALSVLPIHRVIAIARGVDPENDLQRFTSNLKDLLVLREKFPGLTLLVDISHMAGISAENVLTLGGLVIAWNNRVFDQTGSRPMDGFMLETDPDIAAAQCDKDQLLTFKQAEKFINHARSSMKGFT